MSDDKKKRLDGFLLEPQKPIHIDLKSSFSVSLPITRNVSCIKTQLQSDLSISSLKKIVDTGSTFSLVKLSAVQTETNVDRSISHNIAASKKTVFSTLGSILAMISHKRKRFPIIFYVIDD